MAMKLTVFFDYSCPWSFLVSRHVAELEQDFAIDVTWWPLRTARPGRPRLLTPEERDEARAAGVELPAGFHLPDSQRAFELAEFAKDRSAFAVVHAELFAALFGRREDVADASVLDAIAARAGLDLDEIRFERLIGRYAEFVERAVAEARARGFAETPTVVIDEREVITGARDYETYATTLERLGARPRYPGFI